MKLGAVFSDVDGTLVHYKDNLERQGYRYSGLDPDGKQFNSLPIHIWVHETGKIVETVAVPSATLGGGFCSTNTHDLVKQLRHRGVLFVMLTGARTSTFLERRRSGSVPESDYAACEGGGRLWGPQSTLDEAWTDQFAAITGPWRNQLDTPCEDRVGPLWDAYRRLSTPDVLAPGTGRVKLDGKSFATAFMVDVRGDASISPTLGVSSVSDKELSLRRLFAEELGPKYHVAMVVNLGKAHVAPIGLDKRSVVEHIARLENIALRQPGDTPPPSSSSHKRFAAALFDDDNDLGFAALCEVGFLPSVAHPSVVSALPSLGPAFEKAPLEGFLGTEYALQKLLDLC